VVLGQLKRVDEQNSLSSPQPQSSLRSVSLVTALSFGQLLLQFATQLILAKYFGAAGEMDAYVAALAPPTVIASILSGSLVYVLVPVFSDRLVAGGQREAQRVTAQIGVYLVIVSGMVAAVVGVAARPLAAWMCPGFSTPERDLTAQLLTLLAVLIETNSLIAFLNALHHCHRNFALPAWAGVIGTLVTLAYVMLLQPVQGIHAVAWGVALGSLASAFVMIPRFIRDVKEFQLLRTRLEPGTRQALALLAPLVLGTLFWRLDPLLDRFLGSYLSQGSISHLGYAWRMATALMMIGTSGLSIVAFPAIAAHAAGGRREALNTELAYAFRFLWFLLVPVTAGIAVFHQPVVRLLFERGKFTAADTQAVAVLMVIYLGVVVGGSVGDLLSRAFYSLHDMRTPVAISIIVFAIAAGLKLLFAGPLNLGAPGLALATSLYYVVNAGALAALLMPRLGAAMFRGMAGTLLRAAASAAAGCVAALLILRGTQPWLVLPAAAAGAVVYLLAALLLGDEFAVKLKQAAFGPKNGQESP